VTASVNDSSNRLAKITDGNYWYHLDPPNRWTTEGSTNASDWVAVDFGTERKVNTVKLYILDDGEPLSPPKTTSSPPPSPSLWRAGQPSPPEEERAQAGTRKVLAPARIDLEFWDGNVWKAIPGQKRAPEQPAGHRANVVRFSEIETTKVRAVLTHREGSRSGLSEFEIWGDGTAPTSSAPPP